MPPGIAGYDLRNQSGEVTTDLTIQSAHTFHIPVMGTGFTIDTPLRVARYGISSAISLVDDVLIEQMRKFYCKKEGEPYEEITCRDEDARALRITAYLNLVDRLVRRQVEDLQSSTFEAGGEITRYFEMLPESRLKQTYRDMQATGDLTEKARLQEILRSNALPGSIDVNIMTRLDRDVYCDGKKLPAESGDAMAALRGYANSNLQNSIILSAGLNPRLYGYMARFDDFLPDSKGIFKKKIILKVSDFHSAMVQGRFLAKRGLWISEYRIESGLNCGGHAFATRGSLMGPTLEEFKQRKEELVEKLHAVYTKTPAALGRPARDLPREVKISVQGGIGTAWEDEFLQEYYKVDGTGWGTPFLLVPEVSNVDSIHLEKLLTATDRDVCLNSSSPLGIPFWILRNSTSEKDRCRRILEGKPGHPCLKKLAAMNTEFTEVPICLASREYVKRKLEHLSERVCSEKQLSEATEELLGKSCLCRGLAGGVQLKHGIEPEATTTVCCGPNIVNFSKIATLEEMVNHIYGRASLPVSSDRPNMFVRELGLYVDYLRKRIENFSRDLLPRTPEYFREFKENLLEGIEYYRGIAGEFVEEKRKGFLDDLKTLREAIEGMSLVAVC